MLDVRVCPSCLRKRSDGFSRVSEQLWDACLLYLQEHKRAVMEQQDGLLLVYDSSNQETLLMSNEDGFNVEDRLLQEVILAGFDSQRAK